MHKKIFYIYPPSHTKKIKHRFRHCSSIKWTTHQNKATDWVISDPRYFREAQREVEPHQHMLLASELKECVKSKMKFDTYTQSKLMFQIPKSLDLDPPTKQALKITAEIPFYVQHLDKQAEYIDTPEHPLLSHVVSTSAQEEDKNRSQQSSHGGSNWDELKGTFDRLSRNNAMKLTDVINDVNTQRIVRNSLNILRLHMESYWKHIHMKLNSNLMTPDSIYAQLERFGNGSLSMDVKQNVVSEMSLPEISDAFRIVADMIASVQSVLAMIKGLVQLNSAAITALWTNSAASNIPEEYKKKISAAQDNLLQRVQKLLQAPSKVSAKNNNNNTDRSNSSSDMLNVTNWFQGLTQLALQRHEALDFYQAVEKLYESIQLLFSQSATTEQDMFLELLYRMLMLCDMIQSVTLLDLLTLKQVYDSTRTTFMEKLKTTDLTLRCSAEAQESSVCMQHPTQPGRMIGRPVMIILPWVFGSVCTFVSDFQTNPDFWRLFSQWMIPCIMNQSSDAKVAGSNTTLPYPALQVATQKKIRRVVDVCTFLFDSAECVREYRQQQRLTYSPINNRSDDGNVFCETVYRTMQYITQLVQLLPRGQQLLLSNLSTLCCSFKDWNLPIDQWVMNDIQVAAGPGIVPLVEACLKIPYDKPEVFVRAIRELSRVMSRGPDLLESVHRHLAMCIFFLIAGMLAICDTSGDQKTWWQWLTFRSAQSEVSNDLMSLLQCDPMYTDTVQQQTFWDRYFGRFARVFS